MPDITSLFISIAKNQTSFDDSQHQELILKRKKKDHLKDQILNEAYKIIKSIHQLYVFLKIIRQPYLGLDRFNTLVSASRLSSPLTEPSLNLLLESIHAQSSSLNDKDSSELDIQIQIYIKACQDRIHLLNNNCAKVFSTGTSSSSKGLAEHYKSISWLLEKRLVDVSAVHRNLQDMRLEQISYKQDILTGNIQSQKKSTSPSKKPDLQAIFSDTLFDESKENEDNFYSIPQEQLQQLESENQHLLSELEGTLDHVRNATQSIQEISNLQTQLAYHLSTQQETVQSLYEEAWQNTETIAKANQVLVKTEKALGEGRRFAFLFFILAGLILLFLDWYGS